MTSQQEEVYFPLQKVHREVGLSPLSSLCSVHLHVHFNFTLMLIYKNVLSPQVHFRNLRLCHLRICNEP